MLQIQLFLLGFKKMSKCVILGLIDKRGSLGMSKRGRSKKKEVKETVASVPLT